LLEDLPKLQSKNSISTRKGFKMSALKEAIEKLRQTGSIGLEDFRNLKMKDVEHLTEEIKQWCLYGNGKPEKLGKKHKEN
jgi:hypothetical protein